VDRETVKVKEGKRAGKREGRSDGQVGRVGVVVHLRRVCASRGKFSVIQRARFAECFEWVAGKMGLVGLRGDGGAFRMRIGREVGVGYGVSRY